MSRLRDIDMSGAFVRHTDVTNDYASCMAPPTVITVSETLLFKINDSEKINDILSLCFVDVEDDCIKFTVVVDGTNVKPIDDILMMINKKEQFDFDIVRLGYKIEIKNAKFIKINNLIQSSANEYIKVDFEYETMSYINTLKSKLENRSDKIELLKHKIDNQNDI